jgi:phosphate:Na+ symporter
MPIEILTILGTLAGGLGLFLIAVAMITQGLKVAAGRQLRAILQHWTGTRLRSIGSGVIITALAQSSSAVTVATIGFVNAGILQLRQALGVIFGANLGTTLTGWLVAVIGLEFKIEHFALPLIGLGVLLRVSGAGKRRGALGEALAGFGIFFIGIDILREAFAGLAANVDLPQLSAGGAPLELLALVGVGFLMTVLTQASIAAIAIILTAVSGDALPLISAAAMVIGANIGTTSTAALAVIGATSNAKRVAAAHILFNVVTGTIALAILPGLMWLVGELGEELGLAAVPAMILALFHSVFNLLGVLLMLPFTSRLAVFLERRFRTAEETEGRPRYLDKNVLTTPPLAVDALTHELQRVLDIARRMAQTAVSTEHAPGRQIATDAGVARSLAAAINTFVAQLAREPLSKEVADELPQTLRVLRYLLQTVDLAESIAGTKAGGGPPLQPQLAERLAQYHAGVAGFLRDLDPQQATFPSEACVRRADRLEEHYQELKAELLRAGARTDIDIQDMSDVLGQLSRCRRMVQQLFKGVRLLMELRPAETPAAAPENVSAA